MNDLRCYISWREITDAGLGATTNSEHGVANIEAFYDTFASMEKHDLVLNLHGEVLEALAPEGTTLEEAFLPTLKQLHERFPNLRIVVCTALLEIPF